MLEVYKVTIKIPANQKAEFI